MMPLAALRSPSFLSDSIAAALFENHWGWWIAAAVLGGIMLFLSRSRADRRLSRAGAILLGITVLWVAAALFIETPAERLYAAHFALSDAVKRGDVDAIVSYLAPDFTSTPLNITGDTLPKEQIASILKDNGVKETKILAYSSIQKGSAALTSVNVLTSLKDGPFLSGWQLSWDDIPNDNWRIHNAKLLTLNNQSVPDQPLISMFR